MTCSRVYLCLLFCVAVLPSHAQKQQPTIVVKHLNESPREQLQREITEKLLSKKLPDMSWPEAALSEVLTDFEEASGIQFEVNWQALELVGYDENSLVDYKAKNRSLEESLPVILSQVSADVFNDDKLSYAIRNGNLLISTLRETEAITVSRSYNIGALLREPYRPVGLLFSDEAFEDTLAFHAWIRGERRSPLSDAMLLKIYKHHHEEKARELTKLDPDDLVKAAKEAEGQGGLFGDGFDDERRDPNEFVQPVIDDLVELIQSSVSDPEDWLDETYSVRIIGDQFIIKASVPIHREIQTLLNNLMQAEIDKQAAVLKDAHASQQVALANARLKEGDKMGAIEHINQALWIMPDHVPANALKQVLDSIGKKPMPVN